MVTRVKAKMMKIDVVEELHKIRELHANVSSEEIQRTAANVQKEIRKGERS